MIHAFLPRDLPREPEGLDELALDLRGARASAEVALTRWQR